MTGRRVIMIAPRAAEPIVVGLPFDIGGSVQPPIDRLGRRWHDLRISLTDRCNFRCGYCMPKAAFGRGHVFLKQDRLLDFGEIARIARAGVALGVRTLRLTGGEPLLRKGVEELVGVLRGIDADIDIAMTTNGSLLRRKAVALRRAGLDRLTLSMDAIDDRVFRIMNDVDFGVAEVLAGLDAAIDAGFTGTKVNMVVRRGLNDDQIVPMAQHLRDRYRGAVELRFIEYMDVGHSNGWDRGEVVVSERVVERLHARFPLEPAAAGRPSATAARWRYLDGLGHIGTISSVSDPFCGDCVRARLSPDGRLFTCLFAGQGFDLRPYLRADADAGLRAALRAVWRDRADRYSELRGTPSVDARPQRVEMHYIGG